MEDYGGLAGSSAMNWSNLTSPGGAYDHLDNGASQSSNINTKDVMYMIFTPALCIIGCIGNLVNLIVLMKSRVRMRKADGDSNSGTNLGLTLLSMSDLLFCLANCPRAFFNLSDTFAMFHRKEFQLYYQAYGTGVVTTFLLTSTWITVAMATLRYFGICHSFSMRKINNNILSRVVYVFAVVFCIVLNLPAFWQYKIVEYDMSTINKTEIVYLVDLGEFSPDHTKGTIYQWVRVIFGVFVPVLIMFYCNCSLVIALRHSIKMRRQCYVQRNTNRHSNRITRMLITIVIVFVVLVVPSELMDFCNDLIKMDTTRTEVFIVVRSIANVLQVLNFSGNFLLFFILSVHFRNTARELLRDLIPCKRQRLQRQPSTSMRTMRTAVSSAAFTNMV